MNLIEMKNELQRVNNCFRNHTYSEEIIKLFWREFKNISLPRFTAVVDEILSASRFPPVLNDFKKVNSELHFKEYDKEKKQIVDEINANWEKPSATQAQLSIICGELIKSLRGGKSFDENIFSRVFPKKEKVQVRYTNKKTKED